MPSWLIYSLIALSLWGVWGVFGKLAERSLAAGTLVLLGATGGLLVFPIYMAIFHRDFAFQWDKPEYYFALLTGVVGSIGALFFYFALTQGEASRVVVVTALYPVITVLLAFFFLDEPLGWQKVIGIGLALAGVLLLAK